MKDKIFRGHENFVFVGKNLQYQENQRFSGPNEESSSSNVQQVEHKKTKVFFGKRN